MKSEKQAKILAVIAITLAIGGLSIGFAAFSQTLTINGSATVQASNWDVHFQSISGPTLTGTATQVTAPTVDASTTVISAYDVTFVTPGDSVSYDAVIINDGTFDAEVSSISVGAPTCSPAGDSATNVCANVTHTITYADGSAITADDLLAAGDTVTVRITLTYAADTTSAELPTEDVTVGGLASTISYAQA